MNFFTKNADQTLRLGPIISKATGQPITSHTFQTADVEIAGDLGAYASPAATATLIVGGDGDVSIAVIAAEVNFDTITIKFKDAVGDEWYEYRQTLQASVELVEINKQYKWVQNVGDNVGEEVEITIEKV